jgi:hypothetical protein
MLAASATLNQRKTVVEFTQCLLVSLSGAQQRQIISHNTAIAGKSGNFVCEKSTPCPR